MKLAVSALASVLPQGEGIEFFNHLIYEGLPALGQFSAELNNEKVLLECLKTQLTQQGVNQAGNQKHIVISNSEFENFERVQDLCEALEKSKEFLSSGVQSVSIYACELNPGKQSLSTVQAFAFSEGFDFSASKQGAQFALAFSLINHEQTGADYFAVLENFANAESQVDKKQVAVLETSAHVDEKSLSAEFEFSSAELDIALSSVASSLGYSSARLDIASFMKGVLQCYHRYLAGVPVWEKKNNALPWEASGFYITEQSKSWFVDGQNSPRYCLVNVLNQNNSRKQLVLSDRGLGLDRASQYFAYAAPHFFPIAGNVLEDFQVQLVQLSIDIKACASDRALRVLAKQYYENLLDAEDSLDIKQFRGVILAENAENLLFEIDVLEKSLPQAFKRDAKHEIKTPKGSYFTSEPLGEEGKVAFVFPGLGSSYTGLGQKIFQLFPSIFKESFRFTQNVGEELQEKTLYPRVQDALIFQERRQRDMEIVLNLKDLGKTDTTYSSICAHVMTDVFKVHPDMAFGYSMGEANMMTALDVWRNPTDLENRFKKSDIFKNRLYGELKTVKSFWEKNSTLTVSDSSLSSDIWSTYSLRASRESVEACIKAEKLDAVYLTLINTHDNVVIAGEPTQCMRLVDKLACRALPMNFVPAIHCEPTAQEYEGIADLYSMPTTENCTTKLYSSSCYLPVPVRQKAIAYSIAKCFCEPVDFPRLVSKVYGDGARIFLEAGAGRICSTWIDKILEGQKHVIVPLNVKGTEDSLTFARVMAKLFCHKVDVNLAPLYENVA